MNDVGDLSNLISMRIFDCHENDTCSLLMKHYGVSDIVIIETADEIAKAILWKYNITPRERADTP